jgi:hypothetical protein
MPSLGKAMLAGLRTGRLSLTDVPFKARSKKDVRPAFMHELFKQVFDAEGYVLDRPKMIREIRQLTMMFYKFVETPSPDQLRLANLKFIVTDKFVKTDQWPDTIDLVRMHFRSLCPLMPSDIRPHHSNGATFDGYNNVERRVERKFYPGLYQFFGLDAFYPTLDIAQKATQGDIVRIQKSRVSHVPKDSRGPRTICIEAHEPMMAQKGLQVRLYDFIENESPARGWINFTDQSINRLQARIGSISGNLSTIDLKDASDLVSWNLIQELADEEWTQAFQACRSSVAEIDGFDFPLKKFAPMGSALCFPVEAMLFWSICRTITASVFVYGDDIIVPTEHAVACMEALESYGLQVNRDKSYYTGSFRESCGGDYYRGEDVGYVNVKSYDPLSYIATLNNMRVLYGTEVTDVLVGQFEAQTRKPVYREPLDRASNAAPLVYYTDKVAMSSAFFSRRWNMNLQRHEVLLPSVITRSTRRKAGVDDDDYFYFDWLTRFHPSDTPVDYNINAEWSGSEVKRSDSSHLTSTARVVDRQVVYPVTKYTWAPCFRE